MKRWQRYSSYRKMQNRFPAREIIQSGSPRPPRPQVVPNKSVKLAHTFFTRNFQFLTVSMPILFLHIVKLACKRFQKIRHRRVRRTDSSRRANSLPCCEIRYNFLLENQRLVCFWCFMHEILKHWCIRQIYVGSYLSVWYHIACFSSSNRS